MARRKGFEPLRGAVAWAIRQRSVSSLRSSNRTGRCPASGSRTRLHAFALRATPSVVSEHALEFIGCPISRSFTTYCVCLELRSLPSTGVTQLQRYYEPLRHPKAPSLSLAGLRLVIADHALGSRVECAFLVYMPPPIPRCSRWAQSSLNSPSHFNLPQHGLPLGAQT